ncbi:MAG: hypothetical protein JO245_02415 [Pseudolabrys sp.]|nr:hypothetical protein [Pseudolabrys sp.]
MKAIVKYAAVLGAAGLIAAAAVSPSQARGGHTAAAVAGGFVAGAVVGSAVANANNGYYYGPSYGYYEPGYAYEPAYGYGYGYEPAPAYSGYDYGYAYEPAPTYSYGRTWRGRTRSDTGGPLTPNDYNTSASSVQ